MTIRRRDFLRQGAALGSGVWIASRTGFAQEKSPNEKLNIGVIGVANQGGSNLKNVSSQNIVALCDVDERHLAQAAKTHPNAKQYRDYRKMLDEMAKEIDAVTVSTPDHHHVFASVAAMKLGKSVYCEKPLTHSIYEARVMAETAAKSGVTTTMGQGYSGDNLFSYLGAIGAVKEVHCWSNRPIWPQGIERPTATPAVPKELDWDLWLGPAPERPYNPAYHPFKWRGWHDFGTGALGDMACHIMDGPFRGLKLGLPSTIETEADERYKETYPKWCIVRYAFAEPALKFTWYDGGKKPDAALVENAKLGDGGAIFVGVKGTLMGSKLYPAEKFADFKPAPVEKPYPGRHAEWIAAIKARAQTTNPFKYAANMTEAIHLGNVALRVGKRIEWDAAAMKAKNCPEADPYIRREYRKGWEL